MRKIGDALHLNIQGKNIQGKSVRVISRAGDRLATSKGHGRTSREAAVVPSGCYTQENFRPSQLQRGRHRATGSSSPD